MPPVPAPEERRIVHVNVTDFMAQAEEARDPSLRGRPFVLGNPARPRAVVLGVSRAAFREGLRPGMNLALAAKTLKGMAVLAPDPDLYRAADEEISRIVRSYTPLAEEVAGGHCFLDLRGTRLLFGRAEDCANRIRLAVAERTGLRASVALATNKLVSKVGSRVVKPYGFAAVRPGEERSFLGPQDMAILPGVGDRLRERFALLRIDTVGEFADFSDEEAGLIGPRGLQLRDRARGIDSRGLDLGPLEARSLALSFAFESDTNDAAEITARLAAMACELGLGLRGEDLAAGAVALTATYTDGMRVTSRTRLPAAAFLDLDLAAAAAGLLRRVLERRVRIRSLRLEYLDLRRAGTQLDLFLPAEEERRGAVQRAVDGMRRKYGAAAVRVCSAMAG